MSECNYELANLNSSSPYAILVVSGNSATDDPECVSNVTVLGSRYLVMVVGTSSVDGEQEPFSSLYSVEYQFKLPLICFKDNVLLSYDTHNGPQCFSLVFVMCSMAYAYYKMCSVLVQHSPLRLSLFLAVPKAGLSTCAAAGLSFIMTFTVMAVVVSVLFNAPIE